MIDPSRARPTHLHGDTPVNAGMRLIVAECTRQLEENVAGIVEDFTDEGNVERVHQARVALRRLRCADKIFARARFSEHRQNAHWKKIIRDAQWLARKLGNLRNLHVLTTETLPPIAIADTDWLNIAPLRARLRQAIEHAGSSLETALRSRRYRNLAMQLHRWLDSESIVERKNLSKFAKHALTRRAKKVNALAVEWDRLDIEQRHALRKRVKKLRYAVEFFASLYSEKSVKNYLKRLEKIQESLGRLNDIATARALLTPLLKEEKQLAIAASATLGALGTDEKSLIATTAATLSHWTARKSFW